MKKKKLNKNKIEKASGGINLSTIAKAAGLFGLGAGAAYLATADDREKRAEKKDAIQFLKYDDDGREIF